MAKNATKESKLSVSMKEKLFDRWAKNPMGMTFKEYCECFEK